MTDASVARVLHRTLGVLEARGVPCAVMGGFAVRYWGLPRPTFDVDLEGRRIPIVTVEDLLLFKLTANRRKDQLGQAFREAGRDVPRE